MVVDVWTLVTDTDAGLSVFVFATEDEAYQELITIMRRDSGLDAVDLAKLAEIEAARDWDGFDLFQSKLCERCGWLDRFDVESHGVTIGELVPIETGNKQ